MKKDVILVICLLVAVGAVAAAVYALQKQRKLVRGLEEERYSRMVAEESSQKSAAKLATVQAQLKSSEEKMARLKDVLDQEKGVNAELKSQYDKLEQAKTELESKLKSTLGEQSAAGAQ